jgi:hypothetical protein
MSGITKNKDETDDSCLPPPGSDALRAMMDSDYNKLTLLAQKYIPGGVTSTSSSSLSSVVTHHSTQQQQLAPPIFGSNHTGPFSNLTPFERGQANLRAMLKQHPVQATTTTPQSTLTENGQIGVGGNPSFGGYFPPRSDNIPSRKANAPPLQSLVTNPSLQFSPPTTNIASQRLVHFGNPPTVPTDTTDIQRKLDAAQSLVATLQRQNTELVNDLDAAKNGLSKFGSSVLDLDRANRDVELLTSRLRQLESQNKSLHNTVHNQSKTILDKAAILKTKEQSITDQASLLKMKESIIKTQSTHIEKCSQRQFELEEEITKLQSLPQQLIDSQKMELTALREKMAHNLLNLDQERSDHAVLKEQHSTLETKIFLLQTAGEVSKERLEKTIADLKEQCFQLSEHRFQLEAYQAYQLEQFALQSKTIQDLGAKLSTTESQSHEKEQENLLLMQRLCEAEVQMKDGASNDLTIIEDLRDQIQKMSSRCQEKDARILELQGMLLKESSPHSKNQSPNEPMDCQSTETIIEASTTPQDLPEVSPRPKRNSFDVPASIVAPNPKRRCGGSVVATSGSERPKRNATLPVRFDGFDRQVGFKR